MANGLSLEVIERFSPLAIQILFGGKNKRLLSVSGEKSS
jgi:hypothetical protein